jgi:hypothetical protein
MAEFSVVRTARRTHRCETNSYACTRTIQPGEKYVYSSLAPGSDVGNTNWWHAACCAACEIAYGRKHASELGGVSEADRCGSQYVGWRCGLNRDHVARGEKHRVGDGGRSNGATWWRRGIDYDVLVGVTETKPSGGGR